MPPPVLIFDLAALAGVVDDVPDDIYDLGGRFWPGALTIILHSYPSLSWDLGETRGTVAVRVPDDEFALKLLTEHGPLAVSSANKTGQEAALDAQTALESLGEDVAVVIDGGARPKPLESEPNEDGVIVVTERESAPSTILDCTSFPYVVVREGAIPVEELREVVPTILTRAEADEQAARKAEEAGSASSESTSSERALDEQADLDEAYEQFVRMSRRLTRFLLILLARWSLVSRRLRLPHRVRLSQQKPRLKLLGPSLRQRPSRRTCRRISSKLLHVVELGV